MKLILALIFFIVIFYFFQKRKIEAVIILISIALLKFEILIGNKIMPVYQIISFFLFIYLILNYKKKFIKNDHKIFLSVVFFIYGLSFAAFFLRPDASFLGKFQLAFDYAFLFFISLFCIRSENDIYKLINGMCFGTLLVCIIGFIGFYLNDPFFGLQENNYVSSSSDYFQNQVEYNKYTESKTSVNRVKFSASDPNSLGVLMVFGTALALFLFKKSTSKKQNIFIVSSIILFTITIVLSASRTALIILLFLLLFELWNSAFFKKIVFASIIFIITSNLIDVFDYSDIFLNRILDFEEASSFNGRTSRWLYHFEKLNLEYFLFGNSYTGFQGIGSTQSHSNYLSLFYRGGIIVFISFIYLIYRLITEKSSIFPFKFFGLLIVIVGFSFELINSYGPNFLIWPSIAILSVSNKIKKI